MENGMDFKADKLDNKAKFMISWEVQNSTEIKRNHALDKIALRWKKKTPSQPRKEKDVAAKVVNFDASATLKDVETKA